MRALRLSKAMLAAAGPDFGERSKPSVRLARLTISLSTSTSGKVAHALADLPRTGSELCLILPPTSRSEEHTSELQSLMRNSYAVLCLEKKKHKTHKTTS